MSVVKPWRAAERHCACSAPCTAPTVSDCKSRRHVLHDGDVLLVNGHAVQLGKRVHRVASIVLRDQRSISAAISIRLTALPTVHASVLRTYFDARIGARRASHASSSHQQGTVRSISSCRCRRWTSSAASSPKSKNSSPASTKPSPTSSASRPTSNATRPPSSKPPSKAASSQPKPNSPAGRPQLRNWRATPATHPRHARLEPIEREPFAPEVRLSFLRGHLDTASARLAAVRGTSVEPLKYEH